MDKQGNLEETRLMVLRGAPLAPCPDTGCAGASGSQGHWAHWTSAGEMQPQIHQHTIMMSFGCRCGHF